ncbi:MAG: pentapeptide repeat-containing protein [Deltaproteobacteria bacterium]|nr:pentapeptide repeat-containing protein [Deltaproteobacteria bacterium]
MKDVLEPKDLLHLENEARGTLVQILGGAVLLTGLFFTWQTVRATWKNLQISQEGQITERFTRAVDQLGNEKLEVRLGGIYALERIARDSEKDHWPIMEVLTAYVRENAPWKEAQPPQPSKPPQTPSPESKPDTDIQAILTVLGRRTRTYKRGEDQSLDLRETDLRGAKLESAHLEGADFYKAHLEKAILVRVHLDDASLIGTHLEGAYLQGARLKGVLIEGAHLESGGLKGVTGLTQKQINSAYGDEDTSLPDDLQKPEHWKAN